MKEALIKRVLEEIKSDIGNGDTAALAELLSFLPDDNLIQYLPEEEWEDYR